MERLALKNPLVLLRVPDQKNMTKLENTVEHWNGFLFINILQKGFTRWYLYHVFFFFLPARHTTSAVYPWGSPRGRSRQRWYPSCFESANSRHHSWRPHYTTGWRLAWQKETKGLGAITIQNHGMVDVWRCLVAAIKDSSQFLAWPFLGILLKFHLGISRCKLGRGISRTLASGVPDCQDHVIYLRLCSSHSRWSFNVHNSNLSCLAIK